ncbi:MAG: response regulator [Candidatus Sumerlaeia bacterium]
MGLGMAMFSFFTRKAAPAKKHDEHKGPLVAIIEDEQDLAQILKFAFEAEGFSVMTAPNGEIGLAMVRDRKPAIILLDIKMPRMNGYQVLATLHQDPSLAPVPVIVMTSVASEENITDEEWAKRLGVARFLSKPFLPEAIVKAVREVLAEKAD